jgi:uncharacterized integral membrane protein
MLRNVLKWLILLPSAVVIVVFAVANRERISVSLDPFSSVPPAVSVHVPLFLLVLIVLMLGVIIGGVSAWLGQAKWRRTVRRLRLELHHARADADAWKRRAGGGHAVSSRLVPPPTAYRAPPAA